MMPKDQGESIPSVNTDAPRLGFARLSRAGYLTRWAAGRWGGSVYWKRR